MTKFDQLKKKLRTYPPQVRSAIYKGLLKAARLRIEDSKEKILLEKLTASENELNRFKTEYGTLYWKSKQSDNDI